MRRSLAFWLWCALLALAAAGAIPCLLFGLLPYSALKALGDAVSKDGNLETLRVAFYQAARWPALFAGLALVALEGFLVLRAGVSRRLLSRGVSMLGSAARRLLLGFREMLGDLKRWRPGRLEGLTLGIVLLTAAFLRLVLINRTMEYDEAYTFSEFARHSFFQVVTDYHVPNNHVFHTILVRVSYLVFGDQPWALRVPVFMGGLLLVLAIYALGRRLYGAPSGLVAAAGVAVFPVLVLYSVNARGYTLVCLFTVLLLLLADYARGRRNPAAWALMVVFAALGFYTIPIMLYPFGILVTWLALSGLAGDICPAYGGLRGWLAYLAGLCACAALLTILFYLPIFHANGIMTVFKGNKVVEPQSLGVFLSSFPFQFSQAKKELLFPYVPGSTLPLLLAGSLLSIVLQRKISPTRVSLPLAALLFLIPVVLVQRPLILARVWLFLLVLMLLWTAAGLAGLARLLRLGVERQARVQAALAGLLVLILLGAGVQFIRPYWIDPSIARYPYAYDAELVTQYFKENLRAGDIVVVTSDEDAQYWYYFETYGIPEVHIRAIKTRPFRRAFLISHPHPRHSIEETILRFGPDPGFFRMETLKTRVEIRNTVIYEIMPNQAALDSAFGQEPAP